MYFFDDDDVEENNLEDSLIQDWWDDLNIKNKEIFCNIIFPHSHYLILKKKEIKHIYRIISIFETTTYFKCKSHYISAFHYSLSIFDKFFYN